MEKLGVDEGDRNNTKQASKGCPQCGQELEKHGSVLKCPVHGTEPFEEERNPWHPRK
jgi:uncharacterized Zn finger protein (UPF0148 family)